MKRFNHRNTRTRLVELTPISDRQKHERQQYIVNLLHASLGLPLPDAPTRPSSPAPRHSRQTGPLTFQPFAFL